MRCDECGMQSDLLLPILLDDGDTEEEREWCPACTTEALVEVADAEDVQSVS